MITRLYAIFRNIEGALHDLGIGVQRCKHNLTVLEIDIRKRL